MRLILIDRKSGTIFGDPVEYLSLTAQSTDEDIANEADEQNVETLSLAVARQLDESLGESSRTYTFFAQAPGDRLTGYHVYLAKPAGQDGGALRVYDGQDKAMIEYVEANCPYVGFVRSDARTDND